MPCVRNARAAAALAAALALAGCTTLPKDYPREASRAAADTAGTALGRTSERFAAERGGPSGVRLLSRGIDAFVARLVLAEAAERTLDVQYYIWHRDTTGQLLAAALLKAAERGVRVRVLLDDIGTAPDDGNLLALDGHPNIEIRLFNPLATRTARNLGLVLDFSRTNRRMHNKSFTADNQMAVVGGRNVGDEYFEARADVDFGDLDALVLGEVVPKVSASFDRYWNSPSTYPIAALASGSPDPARLGAIRTELAAFVTTEKAGPYAEALRTSPLADDVRQGRVGFTPARVRVLADDPAKVDREDGDDRSGLVLGQMLPEFTGMQRELLLVSPYFVPGPGGVDRLKGLHDRGIRVRIVTNSLAATDVAAVHAGYSKYRQALLEAGIELFEVKATARRRDRDDARGSPVSGSSRASLHAKTLVFDCARLFVGSMNVDPRSVFTNTEIGVMIDAPDLAAGFCKAVEAGLPKTTWRLALAGESGDRHLEWISEEPGREERLATEPNAGGWRRFQAWLFSWLPIEPLL